MGTYYSGITASVSTTAPTSGGPYAFSKWGLDIETGTPKITNFTSGGFQLLLAGVTKGTISLEGPYDFNAMAFTSGDEYTFELAWGSGSGLNITVPAIISRISLEDDVEDAARVRIQAQSSGVFDAYIT